MNSLNLKSPLDKYINGRRYACFFCFELDFKVPGVPIMELIGQICYPPTFVGRISMNIDHLMYRIKTLMTIHNLY